MPKVGPRLRIFLALAGLWLSPAVPAVAQLQDSAELLPQSTRRNFARHFVKNYRRFLVIFAK